jgi:hypothetical protein
MASHPSNAFAHAFLEAQRLSALRARYGVNWPLREFWTDATAEHMRVVERVIEPILREAVEKKRRAGEGEQVGVKGDMSREVQDGETLLEHLVNYTDGELRLEVWM